MNKKILLIFVFLFFISFVYAKPPFVSESLDSSLTIETIGYFKHPINTDYYLHGHVHETSNGVLIKSVERNLSCNYHLYSEYDNWNHVDVGVLDAYGVGMQTNINASLFNETGDYAIMMWCDLVETDLNLGGFIRYGFTVYDEDTVFLNTSNFSLHILILIILIFIIIISLYINVGILGIIGGLGLIFYSFMLFPLSITFGIITILSGIFIMLYSLMMQS